MKLPEFKSFSTVQEAKWVYNAVKERMPALLDIPLEEWNSLKVLHDTPEVWRLWLQLGEVRLNLHLIAGCSDPFFHFHPWPSVVHCVSGGYWHRTGANPAMKQWDPRIQHVEELTAGLPCMETLIVPGSMYIMTEPCLCHQVQVPVARGWNSSFMLMGKPYFPDASRQLSRKKSMSNPRLILSEKIYVVNPVRKYFGLEELKYS